MSGDHLVHAPPSTTVRRSQQEPPEIGPPPQPDAALTEALPHPQPSNAGSALLAAAAGVVRNAAEVRETLLPSLQAVVKQGSAGTLDEKARGLAARLPDGLMRNPAAVDRLREVIEENPKGVRSLLTFSWGSKGKAATRDENRAALLEHLATGGTIETATRLKSRLTARTERNAALADVRAASEPFFVNTQGSRPEPRQPVRDLTDYLSPGDDVELGSPLGLADDGTLVTHSPNAQQQAAAKADFLDGLRLFMTDSFLSKDALDHFMIKVDAEFGAPLRASNSLGGELRELARSVGRTTLPEQPEGPDSHDTRCRDIFRQYVFGHRSRPSYVAVAKLLGDLVAAGLPEPFVRHLQMTCIAPNLGFEPTEAWRDNAIALGRQYEDLIDAGIPLDLVEHLLFDGMSDGGSGDVPSLPQPLQNLETKKARLEVLAPLREQQGAPVSWLLRLVNSDADLPPSPVLQAKAHFLGVAEGMGAPPPYLEELEAAFDADPRIETDQTAMALIGRKAAVLRRLYTDHHAPNDHVRTISARLTQDEGLLDNPNELERVLHRSFDPQRAQAYMANLEPGRAAQLRSQLAGLLRNAEVQARFDALTDDEKLGVLTYSVEHYKLLNSVMRCDRTYDGSYREFVRSGNENKDYRWYNYEVGITEEDATNAWHYARMVSNALDKMPPTPRTTPNVRVMRFEGEDLAVFLAQNQRDTEVMRAGFTSTSYTQATDRETPRVPDSGMANVACVIDDRSGVGRDVSLVADRIQQREVLYASGSRFHIDDRIDSDAANLSNEERQMIARYRSWMRLNRDEPVHVLIMTALPPTYAAAPAAAATGGAG